jgi:hypothetical protein
MSNGRFNTSKCRGKLQKMGVLCTHSSKMPGPSPNFKKKKLIKILKKSKNSKVVKVPNEQGQGQGQSQQPGAPNSSYKNKIKYFLASLFGTCGQLLLVGSSTCPPCPNFF